MQYGPRLGPWTVAAVSAVFGLAAAQVALAANVAALTEPKAPAASSDEFVLPKGGEETLAQAIDPVPLLPRNLTDQASMHAIADYDKSSFDQAAGFISMFNDGSPGLQARPGGEDAVTKLLQDLVINQQSPFDDGDNPDARRQNRISELAPLTFDADNADRLAIIGVSMFDLGVAMQAPGSVTLAIPPPSFKQRALALLQAGSSVFPANRALAIDYPFLQSTVPTTCSPSLAYVFDGIVPLSHWLSAHPADLYHRLRNARPVGRVGTNHVRRWLPSRAYRPGNYCPTHLVQGARR